MANTVVTVRGFPLPFNPGHKRQKSEDSDLSTSSNEAPYQDSSQAALINLLVDSLDTGGLENILQGYTLRAMQDSKTFKLPAKPRNAGGVKTPSGELEPYNHKTFAQEVAQLLVQAYLNHERYPKLNYQTAAVLTMHGTQMKLVIVDVSRTYIQVVTTSACPPPNEYLYVRRSQPFDMQMREGKIEGLKVIQGLLRFLKSGEMNVGVIRGFLENPK